MDQNQTVGEVIMKMLGERNWNQTILSSVIGKPVSLVNMLIHGKRAINAEIAVDLASAFGTEPSFWLSLETQRQLAELQPTNPDIVRRAKCYQIAPINEMKKRGWLPKTDDLQEIEKRVLSLLEIPSVDVIPQLSAAMRMSASYDANLSPSQVAWCARVKRLAQLIPAAKYSDDNIDHCEKALRKLAAYSSEAKKVPDVLAQHGIRFVIVEHLPGTKVDGATVWLSEDSPVIGMSLRYDRIDNFWFTLFHELSHVRHRDAVSIDSNITGSDEIELSVKPAFERRADKEASESIVDPKDLQSFILRVGPLYSEAKIIQFSNKMKIHPGIIVGQLHARNEFTSGYRACRGLLANIRDIVTSQALTDGWGKSIDLKE